MIDYAPTLDIIRSTELNSWSDALSSSIREGFNVARWGDIPKWESALAAIPSVVADRIDLNESAITVDSAKGIDQEVQRALEAELRQLHPWRKGPYNIFGIQIDTEWRSDFKWDRLKDHIAPLKGRQVLDVGCGNGYHCWRMAGAGARLVVGIDPTPLYVYQFQVLQKFINNANVNVFPLGIDDMPDELPHFDTVFSMGLLYHRRAPIDHLLQLFSLLKEGGELVLETLIIEGKTGDVLAPAGRYACMPNVWFIPSVATLEYWLKRAGFSNIRCIDVTKTTSGEQRVTEWMGFHSLSDFLDPANNDLTIEGYPAPQRAIFLCNRPF